MKKDINLFLIIIALISSFFLGFSIPRSSATNILESRQYLDFIKRQDGNFKSWEKKAIFLNKEIRPLLSEISLEEQPVLGEKSGEEKWIEIDLGKQRLYAHEGDKIVYDFLVSTGKWAPTPIGEFRIWIKLRYTTMAGGDKNLGTYYYLPNVPYTMFFYKGYGLHGTYWHNNFGQPMSHGCVNLSIPDAQKLFSWTNPAADGKLVIHPTLSEPGTRVVIHP